MPGTLSQLGGLGLEFGPPWGKDTALKLTRTQVARNKTGHLLIHTFIHSFSKP